MKSLLDSFQQSLERKLERNGATEVKIWRNRNETSIQADKITKLENRFCSLGDAKKKHERDKRANKFVIEGLHNQNKTKWGHFGMRQKRYFSVKK